MSTFGIYVFLIALVASVVATGLMRRYALRANLLDIPNQRSSHQVVTPRGGGLAIVIVFLVGALFMYMLGSIPVPIFLSIFVGGLLVASVGLADDHGHIPVKWRSVVHFLAAINALTLLGGLPAMQFGSAIVDLGIVGDVLAVVFVVWMINLFNFMDGIDGIAATEVICVSGGALLIAALPDGSFMGTLMGLLMASTMGFLVWNWPPASIFMGDVGSGFVGFVLAVIALVTVGLSMITIWSWLILAGVFLVDSTVTLLVRVMSGQTWYMAHNSHAYQKGSRRLNSHRSVTLVVFILNILWLVPIAWFATSVPQYGWWLTLAAWLPLVALAVLLKAGHPDPALSEAQH